MRSILIALPLYVNCSHIDIRDYLKRLQYLKEFIEEITYHNRNPRNLNVTLEEYSELCNMYLGINESEDCIATRE